MRSSRRQLLLMCLFALPALALMVRPCRAGLVLSTETVLSAPGNTGFVEVTLKNDSLTSQALSTFSVDLALGGSGVQFTGADISTTDPYVFTGVGLAPPLTYSTLPGSTLIASDADGTPPGFVTLTAGSTYGLARLAFAVDSNAAAGLRPITYQNVGTTTLFLDDLGRTLTIDQSVTGGVNVLGGPAVPEPSTLAAGLTAVVLAGGGLCWRRRRATA